jgi:hypothetical protein
MFQAEQAHLIRELIFESCAAPCLDAAIIRTRNQLRQVDEIFKWPKVLESADFVVETCESLWWRL